MAKDKPEIRFAGYTDAWEKRQLDDVVEKQIKGKAQLKKLNTGKVEYLDTARLNGGSPILTDGIQDVTQDDILILWDGSKVGTVYSGFEGTLGSTLKAYKTSANSKFVYQFLKLHQDNIYNNYRTPNIPHVQKDFLNVFNIDIPGFEEQGKIGDFFSSLDGLITVNQRKDDLLKELKKGFLQKMFPKMVKINQRYVLLDILMLGKSVNWVKFLILLNLRDLNLQNMLITKKMEKLLLCAD